MEQPNFCAIYQINTRVWLHDLSHRLGHDVTLDNIPDEALTRFTKLGFDWIYFLGIWKTGAAAQQVSASNPDWLKGYAETLGDDLHNEDICGSPFAVKEYLVRPDFGGNEALGRLWLRLRERGLRLLLDFMPNHTALDHPWVGDRSEFYVHGTESDLAREPYNYCRVETASGPRVLGYGRDPNFHGWPDTLQLNYRHPALRDAMQKQLSQIAEVCDGVRCHMAMLILPEIFNRTWGALSQPHDGAAPVESSFWLEAIPFVRQQHPNFVFMAEVYWDMEWTLQQQGFDYTYDKRLYDRLVAQNAEAVRSHLGAGIDFQRKLVRFLENHDERRAAAVFPPEIHRAAAVVALMTPGLRLIHEGQLEGRKIKVSIHLRRRPKEAEDGAIREFYDRLLECIRRPELQKGRWQLLDCRSAWPGNESWRQFIAFGWEGENGQRLLIVVNYAPNCGQCRVALPFPDLGGKRVLLWNLLGPERWEGQGDDFLAEGLYFDLPAWGYHAFEFLGPQPTKIDISPQLETPGLKLRHTLRGHEGWINRIAWSPDGRKLASVSNDRTVRIWDAGTGEALQSFKADRRVLSVAWSPDSKQLAAGGADARIRLWNTESWQEIAPLVGHSNWVNSLAWLPGPTPRLASVSADGTIRLWNLLSGECRILGKHQNNVFSVACSPNGQTIASASADNTVRLWDTETRSPERVLEGHVEQVLSVAWAPDGKTLVSASTDNTVRVWDAKDGRLVTVLELHTNDVRAVCFSFDGLLLATKGADGTVRLWRRNNWQPAAELPEPNGDAWLSGLAFHPQLAVLATLGEMDTAIRIWDLDLEVLEREAPKQEV
jgi:WD40 repeat protein